MSRIDHLILPNYVEFSVMPKAIKDPSKAYDVHDAELTPGCEVIIRGVYLDMSRTDAGADCRIRIHATKTGYSPVIAVHGSQVEIVGE